MSASAFENALMGLVTRVAQFAERVTSEALDAVERVPPNGMACMTTTVTVQGETYYRYACTSANKEKIDAFKHAVQQAGLTS